MYNTLDLFAFMILRKSVSIMFEKFIYVMTFNWECILQSIMFYL